MLLNLINWLMRSAVFITTTFNGVKVLDAAASLQLQQLYFKLVFKLAMYCQFDLGSQHLLVD